MIWIVVADSNHGRIYSFQQKSVRLKLIKEFIHDELKLKKSEYLTSDRPGHYQTKDTTRGAYSPHTDPKEIESIKFAREIAKFVNQGRVENKFDKLIMIVEPHMNGILLQKFDKHVGKLISYNIKKDYMHVNNQNLLKYLQQNFLFRNK